MSEKRSNCPIATVLDIVGDRWTLLVIRDIAFLGKKSFSELSASAEHIPPSTLSCSCARTWLQNLESPADPVGNTATNSPNAVPT
jgi:DNA-binding HxlR family transcriptional regulator